jgi:tight adherence protein C
MLQKSIEENAMRALGIEKGSQVVKSPVVRLLRPFFRPFVPLARSLQSEVLRSKRIRQFKLADMTEEMTPEEFLAYQLFLVFLTLVLFLLFNPAALLSFPVFLLVLAFFFPVKWLQDRIKNKSEMIIRELPHSVDMLALATEAGIGFIAGIQRLVTKRKQTPLMMEFEKMISEIQMGSTRQDALKNMLNRCDAPELNQFVIVLVQATSLGVPISRVLRTQSSKMLLDRYQKAERMGAYATQKLIFPLIFCIIPATIIVIIGPILIAFLIHPS